VPRGTGPTLNAPPVWICARHVCSAVGLGWTMRTTTSPALIGLCFGSTTVPVTHDVQRGSVTETAASPSDAPSIESELHASAWLAALTCTL
jgi:hypothetical protein